MAVTAKSKWSPKDPRDVRDYWFDFGSNDLPAADRFLAAGETIISHTVSIPSEVAQPVPVAPYVALEIVEDDHDDKRIRVRFSGGVAVEKYPCDGWIRTSTGQEFEQTLYLTVKERVK